MLLDWFKGFLKWLSCNLKSYGIIQATRQFVLIAVHTYIHTERKLHSKYHQYNVLKNIERYSHPTLKAVDINLTWHLAVILDIWGFIIMVDIYIHVPQQLSDTFRRGFSPDGAMQTWHWAVTTVTRFTSCSSACELFKSLLCNRFV